ncbi:glycosyltransferase family 4 protein [Salinimicrobium sp. GXAS 041]|uniref:glycosyltransferase family 4 protein n=1 Tax=Salinimicrobium sp. GXAS 041 TaxID=3400806 RepID=UPI003C750B4B
MKILQLVTKRQYRGAEVFAANLSSELINLGHSIFFVGLYENGENVLTVKDAENLDLSKCRSRALSLKLVRKLDDLIKKIQPDIIQCNGSDTLKYMVAASYLSKTPPILYRNISMISEWVTHGYKRLIYKYLFTRISHVSSVGENAIADFIKTFNYPENRTSVIRRGIPIKNVNIQAATIHLKNELGLGSKDQIVMHIGNFSPEKNHKFLIEIFTSISKNYPHIKLVCLGTGTLFKEVKESIVKNKLTQNVYLLGFREDTHELLAGSDFFVLSSKVEGVPGVILEAASQGKPAISTNVGGVSEVLINNKTGFIVDDFNKKEFEERIIQLAQNNKLRTKLGANAYKQVVNHFNPVKNAKTFEDLYFKLIKKY